VVVNDKYRGTLAYFRVHDELRRAAEYQGLTTYQDIASLMGLPLTGNLMGREVGQILGEISEDEVVRGRPMLSALAVNTEGKPGAGFLPFAQQLGPARPDEAVESVLDRERKEAYRMWSRRAGRT
jgi:hypothetical protein